MVSKGHGCCRYIIIIKENKMNRLEKAAAFGAVMGKAAAFNDYNGVLTNAAGFGGLGGLGGAALGGIAGLTGMVGNEKDEDRSGKPRRGALRRALYGATRGGLLGAGAGMLGGAGTAAYQMYNPLKVLKHLHKDRMHAVNNTRPDADEKAQKELIGHNAMLGKVPFTGGMLDTGKMHDAVSQGIDYLKSDTGFRRDIIGNEHSGVLGKMHDAAKYLGLAPR
jgi:hypothetical protein